MISPGAPIVPREVGAQAEHTLTQYERGLRTSGSLDALQVNLEADTGVRSATKWWLAKAVSVWTIVVAVVAGATTWFIDQVMAAWIVALVTAIVMYVTLRRVRYASNRTSVP